MEARDSTVKFVKERKSQQTCTDCCKKVQFLLSTALLRTSCLVLRSAVLGKKLPIRGWIMEIAIRIIAHSLEMNCCASVDSSRHCPRAQPSFVGGRKRRHFISLRRGKSPRMEFCAAMSRRRQHGYNRTYVKLDSVTGARDPPVLSGRPTYTLHDTTF
jgi:hypothetical protein